MRRTTPGVILVTLLTTLLMTLAATTAFAQGDPKAEERSHVDIVIALEDRKSVV